jgi:hypothetical protein
MHMKQGCLHGVSDRAEYRVSVIARKSRKRDGAKGDRKVDK